MNDIRERMERSIETLKKNFAGVRTGRANPSLLDTVMVEAYGQKMPIKQLASVNVVEGRSLGITPFDKSNTQAIEKAISLSGLGLTPQDDGHIIRINLPELTAERREELDKVVKGMAEDARVAIRNIRRDAIDIVKKEGSLSEDQIHGEQNKVQKITDEYTEKIDSLLKNKEAEIKEI
ncbi:ribosome recycling factor [bacterium]|nr:ribosome recycling factor [bacterium]